MSYGQAYWRTFAAEREGKLPEGVTEEQVPTAGTATAQVEAQRTSKEQKRGRDGDNPGSSAQHAAEAGNDDGDAEAEHEEPLRTRQSRRLNGKGAETEGIPDTTRRRKRGKEVDEGTRKQQRQSASAKAPPSPLGDGTGKGGASKGKSKAVSPSTPTPPSPPPQAAADRGGRKRGRVEGNTSDNKKQKGRDHSPVSRSPRTKTPKARGKTKIAKRDVKARRPRGPSLKFSTHALNAFARMIREAEQDEGEDDDGGGHLGGGGTAPST